MEYEVVVRKVESEEIQVFNKELNRLEMVKKEKKTEVRMFRIEQLSYNDPFLKEITAMLTEKANNK